VQWSLSILNRLVVFSLINVTDLLLLLLVTVKYSELTQFIKVVFWSRYELTSSKYVEKLPKGKHSTKGLGRTAPDPSGNYTTKEGVVIPMGPGNSTSVNNTSLLYNEYPFSAFYSTVIL